MAPAQEPQRLLNAKRFFMDYSSSRLDDAVQMVSPSVVYTVPGSNPIAGVFHGRDEVKRHMGKLIEVSRGTFEVLKWIDWMVGDMHIAALQYAQAQNRGGIYRGHHVYLLESDTEDLLSRIQVFFEDQGAADRFFSWAVTD
jgi:ketosteroid isomerase-like protein